MQSDSVAGCGGCCGFAPVLICSIGFIVTCNGVEDLKALRCTIVDSRVGWSGEIGRSTSLRSGTLADKLEVLGCVSKATSGSGSVELVCGAMMLALC